MRPVRNYIISNGMRRAKNTHTQYDIRNMILPCNKILRCDVSLMLSEIAGESLNCSCRLLCPVPAKHLTRMYRIGWVIYVLIDGRIFTLHRTCQRTRQRNDAEGGRSERSRLLASYEAVSITKRTWCSFGRWISFLAGLFYAATSLSYRIRYSRSQRLMLDLRLPERLYLHSPDSTEQHGRRTTLSTFARLLNTVSLSWTWQRGRSQSRPNYEPYQSGICQRNSEGIS